MMNCQRCGGLLIPDQTVGLNDAELVVANWRCFNCGEVLDQTILQNRLTPVGQQDREKRGRPVLARPTSIRRSKGNPKVA